MTGEPSLGCADLNACANNPCRTNASCTDLVAPAPDSPDGRTCSCGPGFLEGSASDCVDIDECTESFDDCGPDSVCDNYLGGFQCRCDGGTLDVNGDGSVCASATQVTSESAHTCAITSTGALHCWGANKSGALYCWGDNWTGQLGIGTKEIAAIPTRVGVTNDWSAVDAGDEHTCGLRAGVLYCWGANDDGKLGDGTTIGAKSPVQVGTSSDWTGIALGLRFTCGTRAGALYCWGQNNSGQLADASIASRPAPGQVGQSTTWSSIATGGEHACGINAVVPLCWGSNGNGELGRSSWTPVQPVAF